VSETHLELTQMSSFAESANSACYFQTFHDVLPQGHTIADPAYMHTSRLSSMSPTAVQDGEGSSAYGNSVCVANGQHLYLMSLSASPTASSMEVEVEVEKNVGRVNDMFTISSRCIINSTIPRPTGESIQSVVCRGNTVYSVDSSGVLEFHNIPSTLPAATAATGSDWTEIKPLVSASIPTGSTSVRAGCGWTGLTVSDPNVPCWVGSVSHRMHWGDVTAGKLVRTSHVAACPTALCSLSLTSSSSSSSSGDSSPSSYLYAVGENGFMSIFDCRQAAKGGCCGRWGMGSTKETILSFDVRDDNTILCAGADKTIYSFDTRRMKPYTKWKTPCKYPIVSLKHSRNTADRTGLVYFAGHDKELLSMQLSDEQCALASNRKRGIASVNEGESSDKLHLSYNRGIRSEANWVGIDLTQDSVGNDQLIGLCDKGHLYVLQNAQKMKLAQYI
jgi:hypothetical protein